MPFRINGGRKLHTAENGYNCGKPGCPCQSAGSQGAEIGPASFWPLRPGSTLCAWCMDEAGLRATARASHGICEKHANEMIARAKARRKR